MSDVKQEKIELTKGVITQQFEPTAAKFLLANGWERSVKADAKHATASKAKAKASNATFRG